MAKGHRSQIKKKEMRLFQRDQSPGLILGQNHHRFDQLVDQMLLLVS